MRNIDQSDVQATLRDMWETRPSRRADDRQVAGVAAAIARRYDVDPTLVRIGFVVAAFSGIGVPLYVAGWLALPGEPGAGDARPRSRQSLTVVGLVVAAVLTVGWWGSGPGIGSLVVGAAALGLLFLLHRSRSEQLGAGADAPTVATATGAPAATGDGPSLVKEGVSTGSTARDPEVVAATPPSWDPLGAAPFAWDLPEPGPAPAPEPPRRRAPVTSVTLGLALLGGAITSFVLLLAGGLSVEDVPVLLGVLLAVVGTGLVVGSFLRAGRGLIPVALLLSALMWGALSVPEDSWRTDNWGDLRIAPTSAAAIQPVYSHGAGGVDIDLSEVDLSVPGGGLGAPIHTRITAGLGDVDVQVPEDADVTVNAETGVGDVEVLDQFRSGPGSQLTVTDLGEDGVPSGRPLVLDIEMGAGNVEVRRG